MKLLWTWLLALCLFLEWSLQGKQFFIDVRHEVLKNFSDNNCVKLAFTAFDDLYNQGAVISAYIKSNEIQELFQSDSDAISVEQTQCLMVLFLYQIYFVSLLPKLQIELQKIHTIQSDIQQTILKQKYSRWSFLHYNKQEMQKKLQRLSQLEEKVAIALGRIRHGSITLTGLKSVNELQQCIYQMAYLTDSSTYVIPSNKFSMVTCFYDDMTQLQQEVKKELIQYKDDFARLLKWSLYVVVGLELTKLSLDWYRDYYQGSSHKDKNSFEELYKNKNKEFEILRQKNKKLSEDIEEKNTKVMHQKQKIQELLKDVVAMQRYSIEPINLDDSSYKLRQKYAKLACQKVGNESGSIVNQCTDAIGQKAFDIKDMIQDKVQDEAISKIEDLTGKKYTEIVQNLNDFKSQVLSLYNYVQNIQWLDNTIAYSGACGLGLLSYYVCADYFDTTKYRKQINKILQSIDRLLNKHIQATEIDFAVEGRLYCLVIELAQCVKYVQDEELLIMHQGVQDLLSLELSYYQKRSVIERLYQTFT